MTTFKNQPSQVTSSYWDPANMANWGIPRSKPANSLTAVETAPLPARPSNTTIHPATAVQEDVEIASMPYVPPHLASINTNTTRSTAPVQATLSHINISHPPSVSNVVTSSKPHSTHTVQDQPKTTASSSLPPHLTTHLTPTAQAITKSTGTPLPRTQIMNTRPSSSTHTTASSKIATSTGRSALSTKNANQKIRLSVPQLHTNPKAAALRSWLDDDLAKSTMYRAAPSQLSFSNSCLDRSTYHTPLASPYASIPICPNTQSKAPQYSPTTTTKAPQPQPQPQPHDHSPPTPTTSPTPSRSSSTHRSALALATRPAKTVDVVRRMICHDLNIQLPREGRQLC